MFLVKSYFPSHCTTTKQNKCNRSNAKSDGMCLEKAWKQWLNQGLGKGCGAAFNLVPMVAILSPELGEGFPNTFSLHLFQLKNLEEMRQRSL